MSSKKKILIVGDWNVDEHWISGIHRSTTSSRVGQIHYRALQTPENALQSFCGAGQTASVLFRAKNKGQRVFDVFGIGIWHMDDTDYLISMLDQSADNIMTPHRLTYKGPTKHTANTNKADLFNLAEILPIQKIENVVGTTKVIRVYQSMGDDPHLLHRIDWDLKRPDKYRDNWIIDKEMLNQKRRGNRKNSPYYLRSFAADLDAIVVKDLCKGVVSDSMIRWLIELCQELDGSKKIPWYISTKNPEVGWLDNLENSNVRLLLIPQVPARNMIRESKVNCWLTESGSISGDATKIIGTFFDKFGSSDKFLVTVLPDGMSVLAAERRRINSNIEYSSHIQSDPRSYEVPVGLPMASIFFSSLISSDLLKPRTKVHIRLSEALNFTRTWMSYEVNRVKNPDSWKPNEVPVIGVSPRLRIESWTSFEWTKEQDEWKMALDVKSFGIVEDRRKKYLHLWRAMTDIPGYVCVDESKRNKIQELKSELITYKSLKDKLHMAYMIVADPGLGKTHLVNCITHSLGFQCIAFNISQMLTKADILDCFDTIVTTQFQTDRNKPILVFFDEINAKLENDQVFDTFLSPLAEGVYTRGGKRFLIQPCVWIFVGTEAPKEMFGKKTRRSIKASDFQSRLALPPFFLTRKKDEPYTEEEKLEALYVGVALLTSFYPDVNKISEKVLKVFFNLPHLEIRMLEHFVQAFRDIQYGTVVSKNVPFKWLDTFGFGTAHERAENRKLAEAKEKFLHEWNNNWKEEGGLVNIKLEP